MTDEPLAPDAFVRRYTEQDFQPDESLSPGDPVLIEALSAHIEREIGPVETVFHEIVSPRVHLDIHHVAPAADRPFHVLATTGMSERPMNTPPEAAAFRYAELLVCLPATWPVSYEAFSDERHYWPIRWLKILGRFPHEYNTWLGYGHSMPNGDPPVPFAEGTSLSGMMLLPPLSLPESAATCVVDRERTVRYWSLIPLHADEMELKLRRGSDALLAHFDKAGVTDVVDPTRPSVAAPRRRSWPF